MFFNFNVHSGRRMFNLNFAAHNKRAALKFARAYVPNLMQLRWVLWSCRSAKTHWRHAGENRPCRRLLDRRRHS
jgi:hypothetical protein